MTPDLAPVADEGMTPDLAPAANIAAELVRGIRDEQLVAPTPCGGITVGDLLDHLESLCVAFTAAATKTAGADGGRAPVPDGSRLGDDWRLRLPARLDELTAAWRPAAAWAGTTRAGGNPLPAEVAGAAALNEVIVHGWDLAVATHQSYPGDTQELVDPLRTAYAWVRGVVAQNPDGSAGLFGPPVPVPDSAALLDRLIGLTGRDPSLATDPAGRP
jgi:uncharacterized protein (TIGR03086 family)